MSWRAEKLAFMQRSCGRIARFTGARAHEWRAALQRVLLGRRYVSRRIYDSQLLLDAADLGINRQLIRYGRREPEQKFLLEHCLEPGMRSFDLGANIGYYTLLMARCVGASGKVHAVEPHPHNYALLRENLRRNCISHVEIENVAVDVRDGVRALLISERSNWHSFHDPAITTEASWREHYRRVMKEPIWVRCRSLAALLEGEPPFDLLRMDLEGYEVEILLALADVSRVATRKLHILLETHPEFYHPVRHDMESVLRRLHERHGYVPKYLISDFEHGSKTFKHIEAASQVFQRCGYRTRYVGKGFENRAIYRGVDFDAAVELICTSENVHAVLLASSSNS
jgi:FkbM family methyltransferase